MISILFFMLLMSFVSGEDDYHGSRSRSETTVKVTVSHKGQLGDRRLIGKTETEKSLKIKVFETFPIKCDIY